MDKKLHLSKREIGQVKSRVKKEAAEIYMFPRLSLLTTKKWFFFFFSPSILLNY